MSILEKIPTRLNIGLMLFFDMFFLYVLRSNLSLSIVAMVQSNKLNENGTLVEQPDYGPRYNWSSLDQSTILGAYFYGYAISSIPLGMLLDKYGFAKAHIGWALVVSILLTVGVALTGGSFALMVTLRFFIGFFSAGMVPALNRFVAKWSPPNEKGKFMSTLFGTDIGTVLTWIICSFLIEKFGWAAAFYGPALSAALFTILWYFVVFDSPAEHPRIPLREREYIEQSMHGLDNDLKVWPPFGSMLMSLPFLSLLLLHYGHIWGMYFLLTAAPKFMSEVLHFDLTSTGFLASLPYLVRLFTGLIFGAIGDWIKTKQLMSTVMIRKVFVIFSHVIPGLLLLGIPYVSYSPFACVALMTISFGFNGAVSLTSYCNSHDLAPNFAGTLYSVMNSVATTAGFLSPLVVAYFTKESNTINEWTNVFAVGAGVYLLPSLVFIIFGSADIQPWNQVRKVKDENTTELPEVQIQNRIS